jgi:hypothetical protein
MLCPLPRYLSTGSESASLYLNVIKVEDQDIVCEATNSAVMDGLMTVRSVPGAPSLADLVEGA